MFITFFRSIILYILVVFVMRVMGKREIGELQPFELAISIMIADLASIPMSDIGVPITNGIIPIIGLLAMHLLISILNLKSVKIRSFICGKPRILIERGKIKEKELIKERMTVDELEEKMRSKDIYNLGDVEYAILETNGELTIIPKPEKRNVTISDLNIEAEYEGISYDLVVDGQVMYKSLKKLGKDYKWLKKEIKKFGYTPEETLIATIDGKGQFYCQKKERK